MGVIVWHLAFTLMKERVHTYAAVGTNNNTMRTCMKLSVMDVSAPTDRDIHSVSSVN